MLHLGVFNSTDSGCALIDGTNVIAAANEERFLREKLVSTFPHRSLEYVLTAGGVDLTDIHRVTVGAWRGIDQDSTLPVLLADLERNTRVGEDAARIARRRIDVSIAQDQDRRNDMVAGLAEWGVARDRVHHIDHHLCHAASAFVPSQFDRSVVLVVDGRGDFRSTSIWLADRESGFELLDCVSELSSLGAMYGFVTTLLGFHHNRHEGKVTGLAAHGSPSDFQGLLSRGLRFSDETGRIEGDIGPYYRPFGSAQLPALGAAAAKSCPEDVAYAAQDLLEKLVVQYLRWHLRRRGLKGINLCCSGGVAGNVKLNQALADMEEVNAIYISPGMADGGIALGGAAYSAFLSEPSRRVSLPNVYLGPQYDRREIERAVRSSGLPFMDLNDEQILEETVSALVHGKVIGWFQGRMEFGPRALGNRSILASAADSEINNTLNERLHRTEFMPFAPVTTAELAERCFLGDTRSIALQFMTLCVRCSDEFSRLCPATVHVDGTARPQVVTKEQNPRYHAVITRYFQRTGRPALINTSFNTHEEPIVMSPEDAIRSFRRGSVDLLVLGNLLLGGPVSLRGEES